MSQFLNSLNEKTKIKFRELGPGILICVTIAAAAGLLSANYGAPHMLFALLLGIRVLVY